MSGRLRVMHLFQEYLHTTENWAYRLIDNLPDMDIAIGSKHFLKNNFYNSKFSYIEFPVKNIEIGTDRFPVQCANILFEKLLQLYPWYIAKMAGRIDLIHSHFSFVGWEYRRLAKKLGVPHVVSFYGFDYEHLPYIAPVWHGRYRKLFEEADLFLCEGDHGARLLEKMGCPADKIRVTKLGVDTGSIPFFERNKSRHELNLLQVATFVEKKGHVHAVQAFMQALRDCPNMTLTLVGGDPEGIREKLRQTVKGTAAENKIVFIDRIEYSRLYDFMRDYHIFIHPSCHSAQMDCEGGAPIVLLDAQATGMPVISTTHCDIPAEVLHNKTGILTPEKDVAALVSSIGTLYRMEQAEYRVFSRAARKHVEDNYDVVHNAATMADIYRKLLEARN